MMHPRTLLPAVLVTSMAGVCVTGASAQSRPAMPLWRAPQPVALAADVPGAQPSRNGRIEGTVTDDKGRPLAGVAVTAHGSELEFAVTDGEGRFVFDGLPAGPYVLRAHMPGFAASRRELVDVQSRSLSTWQFRLVPVDGRTAPARPILAAGLGATADDAPVIEGPDSADHDHSPTAWRVRHVKRSVLRDAKHGDAEADEAAPDAAALDSTNALSFITDLPISGRVHLLTISSFDSPEELFTGSRAPHGVAYVTVSAPAGHDAEWAVQAALTQGDVSSWVVGGSYVATLAGRHVTDVGMSYAAQRYDGGNPVALAAMGETSRTVGAVHAFDKWTLTRAMSLTGGARYEHYGYIESAGLLSPSMEWRWSPAKGQTLRALVSQQMIAPGAEEFVPSPVAGMWMPPQRTFSSLGPTGEFRPEQTRHVEIGFEREVASFVFAARGFRQVVRDQVVTIFGLQGPDQPRSELGHYFTATAGDVSAFGWGVAITRPVASRVRGSLAYTLSHAEWLTADETALFQGLARSAARDVGERVHDVTAVVETEIPETATRVYAAYKVNSSYTSEDRLEIEPSLNGRFDVQVNQRLPFLPLGDSEWEVLVAVRNLFRDPLDGASIYDELLVVRPPKRIVGGLLIRF
jgi:hypothetical protein